MSSHLSCELMHFKRSVFPKALRDNIDPQSVSPLVRATNRTHKLAYRSSNASCANCARAVLGQGSRHEAHIAADPVGNGSVWNRSGPKPLWIELDFNLFEADG